MGGCASVVSSEMLLLSMKNIAVIPLIGLSENVGATSAVIFRHPFWTTPRSVVPLIAS